MNIEELKKQLAEKEELKTRIEASFHQILGQIVLLKDIIAKMEQETKETK